MEQSGITFDDATTQRHPTRDRCGQLVEGPSGRYPAHDMGRPGSAFGAFDEEPQA